MTQWYVPVIAAVVFAHVFRPMLIKNVAQDKEGRARRLVWQFFFAAVIVSTLAGAAVLGGFIQWQWHPGAWPVLLIGVFNSIACYCHWRAMAMNVTVASISAWIDDVTAMALGFLLLQESKYLNPVLTAGILISLVSVIVFSFAKTTTGKANLTLHGRRGIFPWIAVYSLIWGGAVFSMRYFSLNGVPVWLYVPAWYAGSFLGSLIIFYLSDASEQGAPLSLRQAIAKVMPLSSNIVITMPLLYWALHITPLAVAQPLFQVSEMVLPTLIGLIIFREHAVFNPLGWTMIVAGFVGGGTIVASFRPG